MKTFEEILKTVDVDYIKENPETIMGLIESLVFELNARKDYIEKLHEKLLLGASIIEGLKGEQE